MNQPEPGDGRATDEMEERRRPSAWAVYFGRMRGSAPRPVTDRRLSVLAFAWCAGFVGIYLISLPSLYPGWPLSTKLFLIGSFGASAALLYGAPHSPFAQPRHLMLGQLIAALIGVTAYKLLSHHVGLAAAVAVATTIVVMQLTGAVHPPAGATALIAVLGPAQVHRLGYEYVLTPVLAGALILLVIAIIVNNLSSNEGRHYPQTWW
jgi:CBS-domain-containing membrane protein